MLGDRVILHSDLNSFYANVNAKGAYKRQCPRQMLLPVLLSARGRTIRREVNKACTAKCAVHASIKRLLLEAVSRVKGLGPAYAPLTRRDCLGISVRNEN